MNVQGVFTFSSQEVKRRTINMTKAIFLSRTAAHLAIIRVGRSLGIPDEEIAMKGKAHAAYRRGELIGWEAWLPKISGYGGYSPILENDMAV